MFSHSLGAVRRRSSGRRSLQGGAAAVEFALVSTMFIALVMGILQFGWYFFAANSASGAAREAARQLVVGNCWGAGDFTTFVQDQSAVSVVTNAVYAPALPGADVGDEITVTVTADGNLIEFFNFGPNDGQITRAFVARLEDTTVGVCP